MTHTIEIREEERQLVLLGLALMSIDRPGFEYACREASKTFGGEEMFDGFRKANEDRLPEIERLRKIVGRLISGVQHVIELIHPERSARERDIHNHCLGTLTDRDGEPLPRKFEQEIQESLTEDL